MTWNIMAQSVLLSILFIRLSSAGDFLCGDATSLERYIHGVDPSFVSQANCTKPFSAVPTDQTDSQYTLFSTTPFFYLKVVGTAPNGVLTVMTQTEQDIVNALHAAQATALQSFKDEATSNTLCSAADLATVDSVLQTRHDTLQTAINGISTNTAGVIKTVATQINDELLARDKIIARCLRALRVVR